MNQLFNKYLDGNCSETEKQEVENWLKDASEEELNLLLWVKWEQEKGAMPEDETSLLWQNLQVQLGSRNKPGKLRRLQWVLRISAAACVIAIISTLILTFQNGRHTGTETKQVAAVKQTAPAETWNYKANNTPAKKEVKLEDGSVVTLQPKAFIRYKADFEKHQRAVYLVGQATFSVATDKKRPFSVHAGEITTTALGTRFYVNALRIKSAISVRLYEGSVMVGRDDMPSGSRTILKPGQELNYNSATREVAVALFNDKPVMITQVPSATSEGNGIISFSNARLEDVLLKLRTQYQTSIEFNKTEIADIRFTGKITLSDSLQMVLQAIAQMNDLKLEQSGEGFRLTKP